MKKILVSILASVSLCITGMEILEAVETIHQISQGQNSSHETMVEKHCKRGPRGPRGHRGHRGKRGDRGLSGGEFAEAYIVAPSGSTIPVPKNALAPVQFTSVGPISPNISYDPATWTFTVNTSGIYTIEYGALATTLLSGTQPILDMTLSVLINNLQDGITDVLGLIPTDTADFSSTANPSNQITRKLAAGTTITLVTSANNPNAGPDFAPVYGISQTILLLPFLDVAYISIEKIG